MDALFQAHVATVDAVIWATVQTPREWGLILIECDGYACPEAGSCDRRSCVMFDAA